VAQTMTLSPLQTTCLVASPLVALAARVLGTPWLEDPAEYLAKMSDHAGRSDAGAWLALASALLFIPAALTLAAIVGERRRRLARVGGTLAVVGAVGMASVACASLVAGQMARMDDRDTMAELWDRIITEAPLQVFPALVAAGAVGTLVLAVGLYKSGEVPKPAAVLAGLGGATMIMTSGAPVRVAIIAAAVVATVGFAWVALALGGALTEGVGEAAAPGVDR
jgi:hypothetical protein